PSTACWSTNGCAARGERRAKRIAHTAPTLTLLKKLCMYNPELVRPYLRLPRTAKVIASSCWPLRSTLHWHRPTPYRTIRTDIWLPHAPTQPTSALVAGMSAMCQSRGNAPQQNASLFNHLVGAAGERQRHGDAERLGGLEVQEHFDFRGLAALKKSDLANLDR